MSNAYLAVTALTIAANVAIGVADLRRAEFVLHNSARVGVAPSLLPLLAALKIAGAAGLIAGLLGVRPLGAAVATGHSDNGTGTGGQGRRTAGPG
ncbi:DoxX family protein [Verrucosispora sp. WMMD703]|uniref:DoxX family protein n=1 Tax=Verrucosispora sp. WMMD703 TaxID=3403463 RepID=UPI003B93C4E1